MSTRFSLFVVALTVLAIFADAANPLAVTIGRMKKSRQQAAEELGG